jgi:hypothetical protein
MFITKIKSKDKFVKHESKKNFDKMFLKPEKKNVKEKDRRDKEK